MDGFKNTTKMKYMDADGYAMGGYAKGGDAKPATKSAAKASNAGAKSPMKKADGGRVNRMPPIGDSVDSGNRMSKMNAADRAAVLRTAKNPPRKGRRDEEGQRPRRHAEGRVEEQRPRAQVRQWRSGNQSTNGSNYCGLRG
jgi:hypothetical protein